MRAKEDKGKTIWVLSPYSRGPPPIGSVTSPSEGKKVVLSEKELFGLYPEIPEKILV